MVKSNKINFIVLASCFCLGVFGLFNFSNKVKAQNLSAGPLSIVYDGTGPIFSEDSTAPGANETKTITVTNNGTVVHSLALATKNVSGVLADVLYIKPIVSGQEVWSSSIKELSNLSEQSKTVIGQIQPNQAVAFDLKAELISSVNNDYQGKEVAFDLVFGTQEAEPQPSPTATTSAVAPSGQAISAGQIGAFLGAPFRRTLTPAVSPSPSISSSPSPTATQTAGEIKGAQTESEGNGTKLKNWLLLLITPIGVLLALALLPLEIISAFAVPVIGVAATAILSYFFKGSLKPWVFWLILVVELIGFVLINYLLLIRKKRRAVTVKTRRKK